jgi:GTPase SAR1 family protein
VIRRLSYSHASIFLVCFNVVDPESFENIREKWIPELREHAPYGVPIILVGLQSDQRNIVDVKCKLGSRGKRPIKYEEGESLAKKIGARKYVECSSLTQVI